MRALTSEQQLAVARRQGSLLLSAAAGSGKTSVLVERFLKAVMEDEIAPGRILAITFTERAAGELKQRVRERFIELGERELARDTEAAFVSTFHSFCARMLRSHPLIAGVSPSFTIVEGGWSMRLQRLAFRGALADLLASTGDEAVELLAAYGADPLRRIVFTVFAELRSRGELEPRLPEPAPRIAPHEAAVALGASAMRACSELADALSEKPSKRLEDALERVERAATMFAVGDGAPPPLTPATLAKLKLPNAANGPLSCEACEAYREALARYTVARVDELGAHDCLLIDRLLSSFGERYAMLARERGGLDFDELELRARDLLEAHEDVRRSWSERFEMLMVDEFQDTNPRQLAILTALERDNLFTVGDELQSIYGFREADVRIFRARRAALAKHDSSLALTGNFRSRPALIAAVNAVFEARMGAGYTPLIAEREEIAPPSQQPNVELLLTNTRDRENWRVAEAQLLAQRIVELVNSGQASAGEVVVLLRATGELPIYERALGDRGLSTIATVGQFWNGQQVGDLLAYLRAVANPLDELALQSTLASPLVGLSSAALVRVNKGARAAGVSIWAMIQSLDIGDLGLHSPDAERLAHFRDRFIAERARAAWCTPSELLERIIELSGYEGHVLSLVGGERRLANIHKLLRLARRFESVESPELHEFLDHVGDLEGSTEAAEADAAVAVGELDAVRLMSIHAAKGLEFPVVCLADLGRPPRYSSSPSLLVDGERLGLRLSMADGSETQESLDYEQLLAERRQAEAEEEERIFYVGMTRARERLILSGAVDFERWPEPRPSAAPIAWLAPALVSEMPDLASAERSPIQDLACDGAEDVVVRCVLSTTSSVEETPPPLTPQSADDETEREPSPIPAPCSPRGAQLASPSTLQGQSLSYTALNELERCGYRFYLERVLGLPRERSRPDGDTPAGLQARQRGILVHRLLETIDLTRGGSPSPIEVARLARELQIKVSTEELKEIAALVGDASKSIMARRLSMARDLRREHPFAFSIGSGHLVSGVLDAIGVESAGEVLIVDYKSDLVEGEEDLEARVERDYGVQRLIYALAALRDGAPKVEVVHWFLQRPEAWVTAGFSADERPALERVLAELIRGLTASGFAVSSKPNRSLCSGCPGRSGLCSWSEPETSRELPLGSREY